MSENRIINLRRAGIEDLTLLEYWDQQQHVFDADPDDDWNWAYELTRFPSWREQLIAEIAGRPIGFIQIIDPAEEETHYWGTIAPNLRAIDIWIGEKSDLGKGYGTEMMKQAIERCFLDPKVRSILIDPLASNKAAIRFYERLGFQFEENRQFGTSVCQVYKLIRKNWETHKGQ
ncbi:MAG: acetyltransferase [Saprospiraceae bacterium]|nr:acetyltransferase [Saprospiraceae bacterium]